MRGLHSPPCPAQSRRHETKLAGIRKRKTLIGRDGADVLRGTGQNDRLYGMNGNDRLYGNNGNDFLDGGQGSDSRYGGAGDDLIDGGLGRDTLTGGNGRDTLLFAAVEFCADTITDFEAGSDVISFAGRGLDFGDIAIAQQVDGAVITVAAHTLYLAGVAVSDLSGEAFIL